MEAADPRLQEKGGSTTEKNRNEKIRILPWLLLVGSRPPKGCSDQELFILCRPSIPGTGVWKQQDA